MYQPNECELSTTLAALRLWQRVGAVLDVAENVVASAGDFWPLQPNEIEALRERLANAAEPPADEVFAVLEHGELGIAVTVHRTRQAAEKTLRKALSEYESAGEPVFTSGQIDRHIASLATAHERGDCERIEVLDRASLWIDVCELHA
ncbi:MAG: hypothetical protein JF606_15245 [Burkholderiales bacterium]|nr:hypothetical protein [Burkholderiales bacterium]